MAKEGLFYRFLLWRDKHIKEKHFILVISFLVGICTAASAIILKQLIHLIQHLLTGNFDVSGVNYREPSTNTAELLLRLIRAYSFIR